MAANDVVETHNLQCNVHKGKIATGDQFIQSNIYAEWLNNYFGAFCCEMEGAAVAAVCERYNIPFVVIRVMSDNGNSVARNVKKYNSQDAADRSAWVVMNLISRMTSKKQ